MTNNRSAELLLRTDCLFTATEALPKKGWVAVGGGKILAVGEDAAQAQCWIGADTTVYDLGDKLVCPGFSDVHCFFTGYAAGQIGVDLSAQTSPEAIVAAAVEYAAGLAPEQPVFGHGCACDQLNCADPALLDAAFGARPAALFANDGEACWLNTAALTRYGFTHDACYPEASWKLLRDMLSDRAFILPAFEQYMKLMNSRGVTSVKEMGFDDFYGFTDILEQLEAAHQLSIRVNFMSQPVGAGANIPFGEAMRERFQGDFVRFSGYNRMTDGSISQLCGDLKAPYLCADTCCAQEIDYPMIEAETLAVDQAGFRFSLHAQGDAAISKVLDIYEKCSRDSEGKLVNRHSITDLEFSDPADLERMGQLGAIAEIYPQIMSIADHDSKTAMINEKIGEQRGRFYWNRRKMADSGVPLSCGTDLPLLIDDVPESVYHACGGYFPEGGEPFNPQNTLTVSELLTAWTAGGAYNLYAEDKLGTLETGKYADIAVLDGNLFTVPAADARQIKVAMTFVEGNLVYSAL